MDVRAVTLTACVNNPHSSAIKGDRGSLNHCNMQTGPPVAMFSMHANAHDQNT